MQDEKAFIEALLNPNTQQKSFQELVSQYQRPLYAHIRNLVLNHDDADDVLQNTFVKVFRNLNGFKGESKLFSWIYRIATNEALTFLQQKAKRFQTTSEDYLQQQTEKMQADDYFDGDEIQLKLQKGIAQLPEKQQLVFKMKYFEELKYEEISEILGTTVGGLKASYHIAVKKIEEYLSHD
ncbi:RNA polymerase sigma factor [Flavobacterium lacus]|uniref:RNA polymerase sigma factor n=1 Tax=Flavobacterium lacus TaxID=1353778 RepID=A0A328WR14_9FLAO|nr:sigma-70 family RNA polymerase sigma factor [Flavobacterium lacus]RAR48593.1 RNA polymerase sigma-70 factor (ECF subfamily) [Flavobacterium lacus]